MLKEAKRLCLARAVRGISTPIFQCFSFFIPSDVVDIFSCLSFLLNCFSCCDIFMVGEICY